MPLFTVMTIFMTYLLFSVFPRAEGNALIPRLVEKAGGVSWYFNLCLFEPFSVWIQNQLEIKRSPDLLSSTAEMTNALFVHVNMLLVRAHTRAFHVSLQGRAVVCEWWVLAQWKRQVLDNVCHSGFGHQPWWLPQSGSFSWRHYVTVFLVLLWVIGTVVNCFVQLWCLVFPLQLFTWQLARLIKRSAPWRKYLL